MSEQQTNLMVVKISTALSNHPLFVRISDSNATIDHIFTQAIENLRVLGKPLEATQLEDLFKSHQIFNNGVVKSKGNLFSELDTKNQTIGNAVVQVAEIDLISSHSGGMDLQVKSNVIHSWFQSLMSQIFRCEKALGKECGLGETIDKSVRKGMVVSLWNYLDIYLTSFSL